MEEPALIATIPEKIVNPLIESQIITLKFHKKELWQSSHWQAFHLSIEQLKIKYGNDKVFIRTFEIQATDYLIIKLVIIANSDCDETKENFRNEYKTILKAIKEGQIAKLTQDQISQLSQNNNYLETIIGILAVWINDSLGETVDNSNYSSATEAKPQIIHQALGTNTGKALAQTAGGNIQVIENQTNHNYHTQTKPIDFHTKNSQQNIEQINQSPDTLLLKIAGDLIKDKVKYGSEIIRIEKIVSSLNFKYNLKVELTEIKQGSVILKLKGSPEDIQKLKALFKSGELKEVLGIPVEDIQLTHYHTFDINKNINVEVLGFNDKRSLLKEVKIAFDEEIGLLREIDWSAREFSQKNKNSCEFNNPNDNYYYHDEIKVVEEATIIEKSEETVINSKV